MSHATLSNVMDRIAGATPSSDIVVFKSEKHGCLDARFGATVHGARAEADPDFIGRYDATMNQKAIREMLALYVKI